MMPLVSGVIVFVFGGLTLYLHDETFIKLKPTIVYSMFAAGCCWPGSLAQKPVLELLFGPAFSAHRGGLAQAHPALDAVLRRHGDRQRARLAQFLDRCLGQLQGVRLSAAHLAVRACPDAAAPAPWRAAGGAIPKRKSEPKPRLNVIPCVRTAVPCKGIGPYRYLRSRGRDPGVAGNLVNTPYNLSFAVTSSGLYKESEAPLSSKG